MKLPRYREIADRLAAEISAGTWALGAVLPPERQLCGRFGISRHTCREALRRLRDLGLIDTLQGSGTRVAARQARGRADVRFDNIEELLQVGRQTRLQLDSAALLEAPAEIAAALKLPPATLVVRLDGRRFRRDEALPGPGSLACPLSLNTFWLPRPPVAPALGALRDWLQLLGATLQPEQVARVEQQVCARLLSQPQAEALQSEPALAALITQRAYLDAAGRVLAWSSSVHPGERYSLAMTLLHRDERQADPALAAPAA